MSEAPIPRGRRSPLAHRSPIKAMENAARMSEVPFLGKLILRGDPEIQLLQP